MKRGLILFWTILLIAHKSHSQYRVEGLDLSGDLTAWYDALLGDRHLAAYEGTYYPLDHPTAPQNQFFIDGHWAVGSLTYDGQDYPKVQLLYNTFHDQLVIRNEAIHYSPWQATLLNQHKIQRFSMYDKTFVRLESDEAPNGEAGFYELFFDGVAVKLLVKRIKNEYLKATVVYKAEDRYYLQVRGEWAKWTGKRTIYTALENYKSQLKNYGKNLSVRPNSNNEKDMLQLLQYCDQILIK